MTMPHPLSIAGARIAAKKLAERKAKQAALRSKASEAGGLGLGAAATAKAAKQATQKPKTADPVASRSRTRAQRDR